jgi:hypothetical protein
MADMENIVRQLAGSVSPIRPDRHFPRRFRPNRKFNLQLKSHL